MKNKIVIGVAGMPGAGKAIVVEVARKMCYGVVVMGNEVREETKRRDLKQTSENVGRVMLQMRQEGGCIAVAKRCIPKIEKTRSKIVVVDGIRSLYEADTFKNHFPKFQLLAIHASPKTRFKRLYKRARSDDPRKWEVFLKRDWREIRVGLGNAIASADVMIVNDGEKERFRKEVKKFLKEVAKSA